MTAISLFTSGGIGDLAVRDAGFELLVSNEILEDRHAIFSHNFPTTSVITGDIWDAQERIITTAQQRLQGRELDMLYATPPCQGMSKNGRGKLLNAVRAGRKPILDERNRLIIPTIEIARRLRPQIILLENVPEMRHTSILDKDGSNIPILEYVERELGPEYAGRAEVVEFANYGVPQCRQRLITIFSRSQSLKTWLRKNKTFMPPRTHSKNKEYGTRRWVTVRDVIENAPPLDSRNRKLATSDIPYHRVPTLDAVKYWWVKHTAPESSAFDNQCAECGFDGNRTHSAQRNHEGINRARVDTPLYCGKCNGLLPRPSVTKNGEIRLMKGYTSAYKRMAYDKPASALTRNLSYACSDNKLHPEQNRVLSLYEAFRIHGVDQFPYEWKRPDHRKVSDKTIREIIGESIPPAGFAVILKHIVKIYLLQITEKEWGNEAPLFTARVGSQV